MVRLGFHLTSEEFLERCRLTLSIRTNCTGVPNWTRRLQPSKLHRSFNFASAFHRGASATRATAGCHRNFRHDAATRILLAQRLARTSEAMSEDDHSAQRAKRLGPAGRKPAELRHDAASTERAQRTAVMDAAACIPSVAWKRSDASRRETAGKRRGVEVLLQMKISLVSIDHLNQHLFNVVFISIALKAFFLIYWVVALLLRSR